jgi:hypothetical protein
MKSARKTKDEKVMTFEDAGSLLDLVLDFIYFHPRGTRGTAIPFIRGDGGSGNLVIVTGENASGKSFFRRIVGGVCARAKIECIRISMEGRGDSFGGLRSFVYGSESDQSTGENSVGTVLGGIKTCRSRESAHVMVWDEPDIGLSDSWAAGMGKAIAEFAREPGKHTRAIVLVTHRRALIAPLLSESHHYLHLGDARGPRSLSEWFETPVVPRDITQLAEESRKRWKKIQEILNEREKEDS